MSSKFEMAINEFLSQLDEADTASTDPTVVAAQKKAKDAQLAAAEAQKQKEEQEALEARKKADALKSASTPAV